MFSICVKYNLIIYKSIKKKLKVLSSQTKKSKNLKKSRCIYTLVLEFITNFKYVFMSFTTTPKIKKTSILLSAFFLLLFTQYFFAQSVPTYATLISNQAHVNLPANSIDENLVTKAEVMANTGALLGIGAYSGFLELEFPSTLPANTTSYVKIDTEDNLLPALLGGSLGGLLSDVLGGVLIGNQEFTVQAKNGNTVVLEGNSQVSNDFASNTLKIVINSQNEYFIALTPSQAYNRIRLTNRVGSLLGLNNTKSLGVYGAFYVNTPDICGSATYTSFTGTGLNLDLLSLGGAGVTNPQNVIDSDPTNFSQLSLGILSVSASISQTVYFDGLSESTDQFLIRLKVDPSLLALGVSNNIQIIGSNDATVIQSVNLNSLLNLDLLTLLQGNQIAVVPFVPNASVNRITVQYNSLLNVQLTQSLDLFDIKRVPPPPTITDSFTLNPSMCSGSTASLVVETIPGTVINWYSQPEGGTLLATTNSGEAFVTPVLSTNTSFYVAAMKIGCPEESLRVEIDVNVIDLPTADDVIIATPLDACNGSVVLSPTTTIGGGIFRYYKDQLKTQEITTGYAGDAGVTYVLDATTGQMAISGLTAVNSPYNYYISVGINGCENEVNTLKEIVVNYSSGLTLNVTPTIEGCGSVNLADSILNFDTSSDILYTFFDNSSNPILVDLATNITTSGIYFIQSTSLLGGCTSTSQQVVVTVNQQPTLTINNPSSVVNIGDSVTLDATSDGTIIWYDSNGVALPSNVAGPFTSAGTYAFTAVASNGSCSAIQTAYVTVIDPTDCTLPQRIYADNQSWSSNLTGSVQNESAAIDHNPQTFSTIQTGIGLLGIGTTWQNIEWNNTISAGTPVTVKLGSEYDGLALLGAYSIIGTKRNSSGVPVDIGTAQTISSSLVDLLSGENSFEITFVPSDGTGPKDYDGVKITVNSIISLSQNVKIYEAYYNGGTAQLNCSLGDVKDVFSGAADLGVGVATTTVGVDDSFNAVDGSLTTYATMHSGAGILATSYLTVLFSTPTLEGESIQIMMSKPSVILDLNLLTGLTFQTYMGDTPVGSIINNSSSLLSLNLLNGGSESMVTIEPQPYLYDRIEIRFGGVAGVLDLLQIHDVNRIANTHVVDADPSNTIEICAGETIALEPAPQNCVTFIWYDAAVGGNIVSTGSTFTVPTTLMPGTYDFYIQPVRYGCETFDRGKVTVVVGDTAPQNAISQVNINGGSETNICSETGIVTLEALLDSTLTITNPVFYWYSFDGTSQQLITGENQSSIVISNLSSGTYTYYVGIGSDEYCPTAEGDRKEVIFTILPFSLPSDIDADDTLICSGTDAIISPTSSLQNPQFTWYYTNDSSQPIVSGSTVNGVTYTIDSNGALTTSGLTLVDSPYTYYVGLISDTRCLNQAGDFKPVVITVGSGVTPTTNAANQTFCLTSSPTVSDIQVNEPNVTWYSTATGGTALASTDPLIDGTIYYGSITDVSGCESTTRLEVTVTISNGITPTTNNANQTFCLTSSPTVSDIQVNESNVTWYTAATGGTALVSTDPLVDGTIYYGSLIDGSGCESSTRLEVTVTISNGTTPTTNAANQTFCLSSNPIVSDIQVNESNVTWYTVATGGTALASTDPLVDGTIYYGSLIDGSGCESSTRLEVTVTISNGITPTTNATNQTFCLSSNPTVSNLQVNEPNVTWYTAATGGTALASTDPLVDGTIYYGSLIDGSGCESSTRLEVTVTISNGTTPTTNATNQTFCLSSNPTVSNIQVNEPNVTWYTAATGGTTLASTDPLVDGTIYYGSYTDGSGCESGIRLAVTVTISNGTTPTTNEANQTFCQGVNPTVSDIQVNEPNVTWYTAATGGTALASTTPLVDGTIYYGSLIDGSGCESGIRLEVTVSVTTGVTASITGGSLQACVSDQVTYTTNSGMTNYSWVVTNGTIISGGQVTDDFVTVSWSGVGASAVTVTFDNDCSVSTSATYNVNVSVCSDLTISKTVDNSNPLIDDNVIFTITVNNVGSSQLANIIVSEILPSGFTYVTATSSTGTYNNINGSWNIPLIEANQSATLLVTATVLSTGDYTNIAFIESSDPTDTDLDNNIAEVTVFPQCLIVYNEFSPNSDGSNDLFTIDCIENYPNNKLEIFNRYGVLVYSRNRYLNDWDGTANVSGTINKQDKLPSGTYYYILDIGEKNIKKNGWLSIVR